MAESSETESDDSSTNMENTGSDSRLQSDSKDNAKAFGTEILPYQNEPLASTSNSDGSERSDDYERDEDGLTPSVLEQRYENKDMILSWCSCTMCSHDTRAVLILVAQLLKDKSGKSYGRKRGSAENEYMRATGYRWLVRWIFGTLGWEKENTRPLPACIYHDIRTRYVTTQTTGYKSAEERD